ncbi:MAG: NADH-quinone oxidoreductase subunit E [Sphingomonadales bacterium]|nr:NADH-quinone oxidoreductase subunit E [Sphingomonadales bacterium]PIX64627.1 MAG: NADH-quinone oxidoreductase subunit E [Sphingomonadales bacterium CG_4_10_14_3_um_filter_58_15]NCO48397.1 NADH-quinone oxidoreductase subunit E [Sphingomonadales bacterium]NCO99119.1 NADH-quinone oxidoreductase subunit E [Sphingomonadales bacterium]NCP26947.1 NADH-quinone oxidoreductase subunit E [Sphingomonadales bacterium]
MDKTANLEAIVAAHSGREGPLLPILNDIQGAFGCVDEDAKRYLAGALNLSRAEVHGVVSFYHDYKSKPAKLPVLKLCRAEACQARGCDALAADIAAAAKGKCEIETVYCLGLCSVGPNAMIEQTVHARLDGPTLTKLIEAL